jgi:type VI secretion system secreted protein Hcp
MSDDLKLFMKFEGLEGESHDEKFKGQTELESWTYELAGTNHAAGAATGGRVGAATCDGFTVTKASDKISANTEKKLLKGEKVPSITFTKARHGGSKVKEVTLFDAFVASINDTHGRDSRETLVFSFRKIKIESFTDAGTSSGSVTFDVLTRVVS